MPIVKVRDNEPFDIALILCKRTCEKESVLSEVHSNEYYGNPTWERKRKKAADKKHQMKKLASENERNISLY